MARTKTTRRANKAETIVLNSILDAEKAETIFDELGMTDFAAIFSGKKIYAMGNDAETLGEIAKQLIIAGLRFTVKNSAY